MPIIISIYLFLSQNAFARSLKATADKLAQDTNKIALSLGLFGLGLAGIYFMLGRQDAGPKATSVILGIGIAYLGAHIMSFIQGIA